uniref:RING-type E3 ubiquitin transferase n=1 Tax=Davidia involucrata TaxID=16924 RepID=A0A5B7BYM5_DAVIN
MENQLEFIMSKFAHSIVITITNNKYTVFTVIIFFAAQLLLRWFRRRDDRLAVFTFKPNPSNKTTLYCAVCLHDVSHGERYRKLPKCNHCFHVDCIDPWFQSHSTCPLCRRQVSAHLLPQHQQPRSFLSYFLSFSLNILRKMNNALNYEITFTLCENLRYIS